MHTWAVSAFIHLSKVKAIGVLITIFFSEKPLIADEAF